MGLFFSASPKKEDTHPKEIQFPEVEDDALYGQIINVVGEEKDFYKKLDERIPVQEDAPSVWRMSIDHPVVYILVSMKGIQPIHIIEDRYGDMVIFKDEHVQVAVQEMKDICQVKEIKESPLE